MKKLLAGLMGAAAVAAAVSLAPSASADPPFYTNEGQFIGTLYSNGVQARPGYTTSDLVAHGYWVCDILGNHSGGYVASQVWLVNDRITYSQANMIVFAAIANLCPWRWY
jgi:hypothetical protein